MHNRRPRLAYPFTVLTQPDTVRLVAGEDYRYTLAGAGLERWLPGLLGRLTGADTVATLLSALPEDRRRHAETIIARLYGERVLVDGPAAAAHHGRSYSPRVTGSGTLCAQLQRDLPPGDGQPQFSIFCQDHLDYAAALVASAESRRRRELFLWASYGALQRAYVSPLFLPDAGPCFACLLGSFRRLSPAPEIYDALFEHGSAGQSFASADFPPEGIAILHGLVRWKLAQAELAAPSAALYRLHVLEIATFEVSTHRVFIDAECPECRGGRR
jgi:bacteriocin biosynthesis cyclodehydratase domain-containing protein